MSTEQDRQREGESDKKWRNLNNFEDTIQDEGLVTKTFQEYITKCVVIGH